MNSIARFHMEFYLFPLETPQSRRIDQSARHTDGIWNVPILWQEILRCQVSPPLNTVTRRVAADALLIAVIDDDWVGATIPKDPRVRTETPNVPQ